IVASIVSFICFAWGAYRLWSGVISYGTMTLFLQLATSLSGAFSALVAMVPSAIAATTSAGRIMEVTKLPRETVLDSREVENLRETANDGGLSLGLENVSFKYMDGTNVLEDVCIDVPSGEITALIGPSGEGKTTIIRMLLGLLSPCEGNVFVENGQGERCEISASTRRLFSYVPQGNTIFAGTIAENLRMVNENATDSEIIEALKTACAYEFVEKLPDGINNLIGERGVGLSEGQAQRVSIARAILCDAPVLLLDEATSALDVATERRVLAGIMSSKSKKTCLVTTHRPSVLNMCSRIYRVDSTKVSVLSEEDAAKISMEF
ncbi:MAG: ABC transporter ATP-binding protein, partial [Clostridia bacterium]|nr:ABC transporter ATP-binding protein [Clostridia bacterium]